MPCKQCEEEKNNPKPAPCPQCGNKNVSAIGIMARVEGTHLGHLWGKRRVCCTNCGLFVFKQNRGVRPVVSACSTNKDAILAWNNFCYWLNIEAKDKANYLAGILCGTYRVDYKMFETRFWEQPEGSSMGPDKQEEPYCGKCGVSYYEDEYCDCLKTDTKKVEKFWMVTNYEDTHGRDWNPVKGTGPRVRHISKSSAMKEAKRLAKSMSGKKFIVLEATEVITVPSPEPVCEKL